MLSLLFPLYVSPLTDPDCFSDSTHTFPHRLSTIHHQKFQYNPEVLPEVRSCPVHRWLLGPAAEHSRVHIHDIRKTHLSSYSELLYNSQSCRKCRMIIECKIRKIIINPVNGNLQDLILSQVFPVWSVVIAEIAGIHQPVFLCDP